MPVTPRHSPPLPPLVLVTSCNKLLAGHASHTVGRKYVDAVRLAGALPLIAPPFTEAQLPALLSQVHGVLLTGSPSNVHPSHFGQAVHDETLPLDPERDAWTLPLVRLAIERGVRLAGGKPALHELYRYASISGHCKEIAAVGWIRVKELVAGAVSRLGKPRSA